MWRLAGIAASAATALVLAAALLAFYAIDRFERPGPLTSDSIVYIPRGAGLGAIAGELERAGVIGDPLVFRLGVRVLGRTRDLQAGEYLFPAGIAMREAAELLHSGKTVARRLTLAEGLTSAQIVALVARAEGLDGQMAGVPPEGTLLPETYHYGRGDSRTELAERMRQALDEVVAELWSKRAPGLPLATPFEAVILASIVEKETAVPEERTLIASVFLNRLGKGMRLQSDPTVVYGLTQGRGPLGRALTREDLKSPSPYNTYLIDGLPPGPIANPGRAAIAAVLDPAESEYLYFVADGSGGHAFARTLSEHNRNVGKWRKIRKRQE